MPRWLTILGGAGLANFADDHAALPSILVKRIMGRAMQHSWVFEVLDDMKAFAEHHGFNALAAQLEDARLTAAAEIPAKDFAAPARCQDDAVSSGASSQEAAGSERRWRCPDMFRYGPYGRN